MTDFGSEQWVLDTGTRRSKCQFHVYILFIYSFTNVNMHYSCYGYFVNLASHGNTIKIRSRSRSEAGLEIRGNNQAEGQNKQNLKQLTISISSLLVYQTQQLLVDCGFVRRNIQIGESTPLLFWKVRSPRFTKWTKAIKLKIDRIDTRSPFIHIQTRITWY